MATTPANAGAPSFAALEADVVALTADARSHLERVEAQADDELLALSRRFNARLCELQPDASKRSWFCLFQDVDLDGSGNISFGELVVAVRDGLLLSEAALPEAALHALWRKLDRNDAADAQRPGFRL